MDHFLYHNHQLFAEDVPVAEIAKQWGTPCYIYSRATLERHWHVFDRAFGKQSHKICYAVKANSNIAILQLLARLGSGFDIVSQGELERVLVAGGDPASIIFSGVGKLVPEFKRALEVGVGCFNVESLGEVFQLQEIAKDLNKIAPISVRVNPDIDARTHPYISTGLKENKFGIAMEEALAVYKTAKTLPNLAIAGIGFHIGSQLTEIQPFLDATERVYDLMLQLKNDGIEITHLDIGGGLGVRYTDENPPEPAAYIGALLEKLGSQPFTIIVEPGRAIAANAGILVTQVAYLKKTAHKNFAIVDAGMNDLLRPSLYNAYQNIVPVKPRTGEDSETWDIVGPVCETGDFLGKDRVFALKEKDLLAIRTAGAYGFTMSSNYNSRPRAAELLVDGAKVHLIRERETFADLYRHEILLKDE